MKNFKKVLALVLAVVMLLSFATVASAVTSDYYKDADSIDYTEAVDVLGSIGVLNGFPDDTFRPEATITRAQAAKIIAMFDNGSTDINKLYTAANPFADCVNHWAESYIAYGVKTGIVAGVGGDKFAPEANVTGVQFLKMVLVVLGYDAKVEGLEGKNWDVNTLALAKQVGLTATLGNKFDYSADLTRQEAAVIMLDALKSDCVTYGTKLGVNYDRVAEELKNWNETDKWLGVNINGVFYMTVSGAVKTGDQLMELWGLEEGYYEDAFMRPYTTWTLNGSTVLKYMYPVKAQYTSANTLCNLFVDLGVAKTDYTTNLKLAHYVNGGEGEYNDLVDSHDILTDCDLTTKVIGSQGTLTQVFKVGGVYRICEIETWLGRVSDVTKNTSKRDGHLLADDIVTVQVALDGSLNSADAIEVAVVANSFTKGEWVLVTYSVKQTTSNNDYGVQSVVSAKTETAQFTGLDSYETKVGADWKYDAEHFYIGNTGTQYGAGYAAIDGFDRVKLPANLKGTYTFIYDTYGNVIGMVDATSAAPGYLVIDWMYMTAVTGNEKLNANVVGLDATITEGVNVSTFLGKLPTYWVTSNPDYWGVEYGVNWASRYDTLYTYSKDDNGNYYIGKADYDEYTEVSIIDGKAYLFSGETKNTILTDDTQILIHEMDGTYTADTGKTVGTIYASNAQVIDANDDGVAEIVYLYGGSNGYVFREASKTTGFVAADLLNPPKIEIVDGLQLVKVEVYFNGEAKTIYVESAVYEDVIANNVGFYTFRFTKALSDGNFLCDVSAYNAELSTEYTVVALTGNTLITSGDAYKVAADVVIYDVYNGVLTKVDSLTADTVMLNFNAAGVVTAIYCLAD